MKSNFKYITTPQGATDLLVWMTWGAPLVSLLTSAVLRVVSYSSIAYAVVPLIKFFVVLYAFSNLKKYIKAKDIVFYVICAFVLLLQFPLFQENTEWLVEWGPKFIFASLPLYFIGLIINVHRNEKVLFVISVLCIALAYFYSFFYKRDNIQIEVKQYASMYWAYLYLPHVLYVIFYTVKKFNIINLLLSLAGFFMILSYGSRGPALCVLIFVPGVLFLFRKFKHPIVSLIIIGVAVLLFNIYFEYIVLLLQTLIDMAGMKTRVLDKYLLGEISDSSGRDGYIPILMSKIMDGGSWGYGICGSWRFIQSYPHNLLLELWVSFGLIPGSLLFLTLVIIIIKGLKSCLDNDEKAFLLLLFVRGFFMLFLSYTFLDNGYFFMLIGYCIYLICRRKLYSVTGMVQNK